MDIFNPVRDFVTKNSLVVVAVLVVVILLMTFVMFREGLTSSAEPVVVHSTPQVDADYWAKHYDGGRVIYGLDGNVKKVVSGTWRDVPDDTVCDTHWNEKHPRGGDCRELPGMYSDVMGYENPELLRQQAEAAKEGMCGCPPDSNGEYHRSGGELVPVTGGQASVRSIISGGSAIRNKSERSESARDSTYGHKGEGEWRREQEIGEYYHPKAMGGAHGDHKRYDEAYLNANLHGHS